MPRILRVNAPMVSRSARPNPWRASGRSSNLFRPARYHVDEISATRCHQVTRRAVGASGSTRRLDRDHRPRPVAECTFNRLRRPLRARDSEGVRPMEPGGSQGARPNEATKPPFKLRYSPLLQPRQPRRPPYGVRPASAPLAPRSTAFSCGPALPGPDGGQIGSWNPSAPRYRRASERSPLSRLRAAGPRYP